MTLPAPNLDDRRFQDIVDEAKKLIPGLRTVGFGDVGECPPKEAHHGLRVVA